MPYDDEGNLKLEGAAATSAGRVAVREVAERLQRHYDRGATGLVAITAWEAGAVLNVLIGKAPPVQPSEGVNDRRDEWEKGPA